MKPPKPVAAPPQKVYAIPLTIVSQAQMDATAAMARAMHVGTDPTEMDEAIAWMQKRWGAYPTEGGSFTVEEGR